MRQDILNAVQDKSLLDKVSKELDFMEVTEGLNGRPLLETFYDIWQAKKGETGTSNNINSWTAYAIGMVSEKPTGEFLSKRRAFARKGFPDIDTDFDYELRDGVFNYMIERYGRENVGNIGTYGSLSLKSYIARCGKVLDVADAFHKGAEEYRSENHQKVLEINKSLDQYKRGAFLKVYKDGEEHVIKTVSDAYEYCDDFRYYMDKYPELLRHAPQIEGLHSNFGIHAAGVVVSDIPLANIAPLRTGDRSSGKDTLATQYVGEDLESIGLIKFDVLALSTLSVISRCVKLVKENYDIDIDIRNMPLDDEKTFELYRSGRLTGVFQCEEPGMQKTMQKVGVDTFDDVMAAVALYRPGPMESIPEYCSRKNGESPVSYFHETIEPHVKPILERTYGILVYQEQVMQICNALAGFSISDGYVVIKAIGKKKEDLLKKYRKQFIEGCQAKGITEDLGQTYWDDFISPFAAYGFNASHSCCYAYMSYTTAYLKANFPDEFMCAYLNVETRRSKWEKVDTLWNEAEKMNIEIMPRRVGYCKLEYEIASKADAASGVAKTKILPSIMCKGLSHRAAENIVAHQPYKNLKDFAMRTDTKDVDTKAVEALVDGGFFPSAKKNHVLDQFRAVRNDRKKNDRRGFQMGGDVFDDDD